MEGLFYSPFVVPVAAFIMVLGIIAFNTYHRIEVRRMQNQERLAAIARGLPLAPEPAPVQDGDPWPSDPYRRAANTRKSAIVLIAVGLGIIVGLGMIAHVVGERHVLAGCIGGIIPLFIGLGMWIDYEMQKRELERMAANQPQPPAAGRP